jgi:hypothetical protein
MSNAQRRPKNVEWGKLVSRVSRLPSLGTWYIAVTIYFPNEAKEIT